MSTLTILIFSLSVTSKFADVVFIAQQSSKDSHKREAIKSFFHNFFSQNYLRFLGYFSLWNYWKFFNIQDTYTVGWRSWKIPFTKFSRSAFNSKKRIKFSVRMRLLTSHQYRTSRVENLSSTLMRRRDQRPSCRRGVV